MKAVVVKALGGPACLQLVKSGKLEVMIEGP